MEERMEAALRGCVERYEEAVDSMTSRLRPGEPEAGEVVQAVRFLLTLGQGDRRPLVRPMLEAAQGHALPLIPLLEPGQAEELAHWYGASYPRRQRLPIQERVLRALEERSGR